MTPPRNDNRASLAFPRLDVRWQTRRANFLESCRAALLGPSPARNFDPALSFFRLRLSPRKAPGRGIAGSLVWHVVLLVLLVPLGRMAEPPPKFTLPQIQITWYGPTTDVAPAAAPKPSGPKPSTRPAPRPKRPLIARAYNPKTTVVFRPPRATSNRQVLIEPDAPPTPPKFLPSLPNIITWASAHPVQPKISVNPDALVARKPKNGSVAEATAPQISPAAPPPAPLDISPAASAALQPPIPLAPGLIRGRHSKTLPKSETAPAITFAGSRLVALSFLPGEAPPPPGNALAPISIGPRVGKETSSSPPKTASNAGANLAGKLAASAAMPGPAGLLISHAGTEPVPPPPPRAPSPRPTIPAPSPLPARQVPSRPDRSAGLDAVQPHDLVHEVLGMRPIHTLLMNMPNLTSATGSWVLNFTELPGEKIPLGGSIVAPLPVQKVDPEYPPELIQEGVQGEVVLYAVIGRDGKVSNIRIVQSLDPVLDRNAEAAFAKWKFQPALADNYPIALEVLVHIPFYYKAPQ